MMGKEHESKMNILKYLGMHLRYFVTAAKCTFLGAWKRRKSAPGPGTVLYFMVLT